MLLFIITRYILLLEGGISLKITYFSSNNEILTVLGDRIKAERIASGKTQKELAENAGIAQKTLSSMETGNDVSLTTLIEVLRALGHLQNIDMLVPEQGIRPSDILALGKKRERFKKAKNTTAEPSVWEWGDEV